MKQIQGGGYPFDRNERYDAPHTLLGVVGALLFSLFLMFSSYQRALFFEEDFYMLHMVLYAIALVFLFIRFNTRTEISRIVVFPYAIGGLYALHLLLGEAVSVKGTIDQAMRWTSYGCFFMMLYVFGRSNRKHRAYLDIGLQCTGIFIAIGAFMGLYGIIEFKDIAVKMNDPRLSALGVRLSGYFQYANTFAAVMGAFGMYHLISIARSRSLSSVLLTSLPMALYGTAVLLSESRASWLALSASWFIGLLIVKHWDRAVYILATFIAVLASIGAYTAISSEWNENAAYPGLNMLLILLFGSAAGITWIWHICRGQERLGRADVAARVVWIGIGAVAVLIVWLFPGTLQQRALQHYDTAFARSLFYEDGWQMFRDSPAIGYGGGSWESLYTKYQQQPYVGSEVHSGYLNILLDLGIAGAVVIAVMLILFLYKMAIGCKEWLPPLCVLLVHSAVDFDMSYGFVWFLLLWMVAAGIAQPDSGRTAYRLSWENRRFSRYQTRNWLPTLGLTGIVLVLLAGFVFAYRFEMGSRAFNAAKESRNGSPAVVEAHLRKALQWNPYNSTFRMALADVMPESAAAKSRKDRLSRLRMLQEGLAYEPEEPQLIWSIGWSYANAGLYEQSIRTLDRALQLDRFNKTKQEGYIRILNEIAETRLNRGKAEEAQYYSEKALNVYEKYRALVTEVRQQAHPANGRKFLLTAEAREQAEIARQALAQYD